MRTTLFRPDGKTVHIISSFMVRECGNRSAHRGWNRWKIAYRFARSRFCQENFHVIFFYHGKWKFRQVHFHKLFSVWRILPSVVEVNHGVFVCFDLIYWVNKQSIQGPNSRLLYCNYLLLHYRKSRVYSVNQIWNGLTGCTYPTKRLYKAKVN